MDLMLFAVVLLYSPWWCIHHHIAYRKITCIRQVCLNNFNSFFFSFIVIHRSKLFIYHWQQHPKSSILVSYLLGFCCQKHMYGGIIRRVSRHCRGTTFPKSPREWWIWIRSQEYEDILWSVWWIGVIKAVT